MSNPDILFRGIPRGPTRGYTARVILATQPGKVVIPCCGSFSLAAVAVEAGVASRDIFCGDISLYSTALGHAFMGTDWRLEVRDSAFADVLAPFMGDPVGKAATVMLALRVLQYDRETVYHRDRQRELLENAALYMDQLREQIEALAARLHGLTYRAQDMWITLEETRNDPDACILLNPPRYTGGYDRMFAGIDKVFDWDEPRVGQFVEADYSRMMDLMGPSQALTLMYYATPDEDPAGLWGAPWRSVFADKPSDKRAAAINWIVANQDPLGVMVTRRKIGDGQAMFPLFEGEITPDTVLVATKVSRQVGDYYRDLLIHALPGSFTEAYVALLADGHLLSVVGVHLGSWRRGQLMRISETEEARSVHITFAFTVPHSSYSRLHKLTLLSLLSSWFWDDVFVGEDSYVFEGPPKGIVSTMLTRHPENKTARGTGMKLTNREQQQTERTSSATRGRCRRAKDRKRSVTGSRRSVRRASKRDPARSQQSDSASRRLPALRASG